MIIPNASLNRRIASNFTKVRRKLDRSETTESLYGWQRRLVKLLLGEYMTRGQVIFFLEIIDFVNLTKGE